MNLLNENVMVAIASYLEVEELVALAKSAKSVKPGYYSLIADSQYLWRYMLKRDFDIKDDGFTAKAQYIERYIAVRTAMPELTMKYINGLDERICNDMKILALNADLFIRENIERRPEMLTYPIVKRRLMAIDQKLTRHTGEVVVQEGRIRIDPIHEDHYAAILAINFQYAPDQDRTQHLYIRLMACRQIQFCREILNGVMAEVALNGFANDRAFQDEEQPNIWNPFINLRDRRRQRLLERRAPARHQFLGGAHHRGMRRPPVRHQHFDVFGELMRTIVSVGQFAIQFSVAATFATVVTLCILLANQQQQGTNFKPNKNPDDTDPDLDPKRGLSPMRKM